MHRTPGAVASARQLDSANPARCGAVRLVSVHMGRDQLDSLVSWQRQLERYASHGAYADPSPDDAMGRWPGLMPQQQPSPNAISQ